MDEELDLNVKHSNPFDNECLPLVESFQLTNLNDLSEHENRVKNNFIDDHHEKQYSCNSTDANNNTNVNKDSDSDRSNELEEEIKSISSIEGSLKGVSCQSNYELLAGLSSSTPLHLYPKLGKLFK